MAATAAAIRSSSTSCRPTSTSRRTRSSPTRPIPRRTSCSRASATARSSTTSRSTASGRSPAGCRSMPRDQLEYAYVDLVTGNFQGVGNCNNGIHTAHESAQVRSRRVGLGQRGDRAVLVDVRQLRVSGGPEHQADQPRRDPVARPRPDRVYSPDDALGSRCRAGVVQLLVVDGLRIRSGPGHVSPRNARRRDHLQADSCKLRQRRRVRGASVHSRHVWLLRFAVHRRRLLRYVSADDHQLQSIVRAGDSNLSETITTYTARDATPRARRCIRDASCDCRGGPAGGCVRCAALADGRPVPRWSHACLCRRRPGTRTCSTWRRSTAACGRPMTPVARGTRSSTTSRRNRSARSRSRLRTRTSIYVGSGEGLQRPDLSVGNGVYRSTDAGKTWTHVGLDDAQQIPQIAVDPRNPGPVFAAVLGHPYGPNHDRGVYRSLDGGRTWKKVLVQGRQHRRVGHRDRSEESRRGLRGDLGGAPRPVGGRQRVPGHGRRPLQVDRRRHDMEASSRRLAREPRAGRIAIAPSRLRDRAVRRSERRTAAAGTGSIAPTMPARRGRGHRGRPAADADRRRRSAVPSSIRRTPTSSTSRASSR